MILCHFLLDVFKVYSSNIDSETAEILKKGDFEFGRGRRTLLWFEIWPLDTSSEGLIRFSRMPNMQVLCPYYQCYSQDQAIRDQDQDQDHTPRDQDQDQDREAQDQDQKSETKTGNFRDQDQESKTKTSVYLTDTNL